MDRDTAHVFAAAIDDWSVLTGAFDFDRYFPNEEVCRAYLFLQRWPSGFACPRCCDVSGYEMRSRDLVECANRECRYQTSITSGTMFHRTKLPLRKWFKALQLYTKHNVYSPTAMSGLIKVSYKTAWLLIRKMSTALRHYNRELLKDLSHPLAVILSDPYVEEGMGIDEQALMAAECTEGPEEEGVLPADPKIAAALNAAGLLQNRKITTEEWKKRRFVTKVLFSTPRWQVPNFFMLYFFACIHAP
ncbi:transposase, partial [Paenibacillus alkalitolerans]|uniref:transposase n=1 Tax=Paenibacillus alkalitolerans TaxID=2799335 RepID=UPI0018F56ED2